MHGINGAWGTLAAALFNIDGVTAKLVGVQLLGIGTAFVWSFGCCYILFKILKATVGLWVAEEEELEGLDIAEHGGHAYFDFQMGSKQA